MKRELPSVYRQTRRGAPALAVGAPDESPDGGAAFEALEREVVELFVRVADLLGLPRSVGELYGALFISPRPLHMDALRARLNLSKGATSQGLRLLRQFGAVRVVSRPGDRRDHYVAETELRALAGGFLREQVQPHLRSGVERVAAIERFLRELPNAERAVLTDRVRRLKRWRGRAERILPLLLKLIRA